MTTQYMPALGQPGRTDFIDISQVQASVDFKKVAAAGFRAVVAKASEGLRYCDPLIQSHLAHARDAGMLTAVYGFARPSHGNPREQARKLWDCVGDVAPGRLVLDLETWPDGWDGRQVLDFAETYADEQRKLDGGSAPWVYSYVSFLMRLGPALINSSLLDCPLWIAHYRSTTTPWAPSAIQQPIVPMPWSTWTAFQYSGNGGYRVPGVAGDCDRNLFHGDEAALRRAFGMTGRSEPPAAIVHPRVPFGRPALDDEDP
jgi:lysozyme